MSNFLHQLWDETLAGPAPETDLGKLSKHRSYSASQSPPMKISDHIPVTRSITILKSNSSLRNSADYRSRAMADDSASGISSPRTPTTPGTPGADFKRFTWRKSSIEPSERDV